MQEQDEHEIPDDKVCCFNCMFFEPRTRFCRYDPPQVVNIVVAGNVYPTANFPKIPIPDRDYCSKFKNFKSI